MDIVEAIKGRRSVRAYTEQPVDAVTIRELIEAAVQAPSAMNLQPWAFGIIQGADRLRDYSDRAKIALLRSIDSLPALAKYKSAFENPKFNIFYEAPALIVIYGSHGAGSPTVEGDCALAAQNLMLAAHARGLGTCWIGFARIYFDQPEVKAEFGISDEYSVIAPIIVGHPKTRPSASDRAAPKILFHR